MSYFSLEIHSNDAYDKTPTVIFFGFTKIESSRRVLLCPFDTLDLPGKNDSLKRVRRENGGNNGVRIMIVHEGDCSD
jgi:hypothetical protein